MEDQFKIVTHLNGNYLHLKLIGRITGVSGRELVDLLKRYIRSVSTVIIHTNSLIRDSQFAQDTFRDELLSLKEQPVQFIVTGEHASLFT